MGFDLMINFRQPYFARSIREFWQRWHISLSTWFRDYVYIPLGGNRVSVMRWYANLMIVFIVSGLWHGANWTFAIWGALHGGYLVLAIVLAPLMAQFFKTFRIKADAWYVQFVQIILVFILVNIGWVFFRAPDVTTAFNIVGRFFVISDYVNFSPGELFDLNIPRIHVQLLWSFVGIALLSVLDFIQSETPRVKDRLWNVGVIRYATYIAGIYIIVFFGVFDEIAFIYFQF